MYVVYMHTNKINNKKYIGITCRKPEYRFGKDGSGYKECPVFYKAICKYGWESFDHEILFDNMTREEAAAKEIELIEKYNTRDIQFGYNVAIGGYSQPGETNPFYGHHHTDEVKQKIAESNKKRVWTEEAKNSIREKLSGPSSPFAKKIHCNELNIDFDTLREAAKYIGASAGKVSEVANGKRKSVKGYTFYYIM